MFANQWRSSHQFAMTPIELVRVTEEKALHFAASPSAGYLAGYSPHHQSFSGVEDERLTHVSSWNSELSWLYAVAEQDIPEKSYRWGIVELPSGHFKLVLEQAVPAGDMALSHHGMA
jgi:hypothetical protein